ncbi:MAG TPA: hypothetical protein VNI20_05645 [Fimbriimonadaceae bacterium]|nr:hypothetical protein [Fimbriimonadaceae bacterium]
MAVTRFFGGACALLLAGFWANASAALIFDTYDFLSDTGVFVGPHDFQIGDRMVLPAPQKGTLWRVDSYTGQAGVSTAGSYTDFLATISIYRTVNLVGTGPAFSDLVGSTTRNLGSFFAGAPGTGPDFVANNLGIVLSAPPSDALVGYGILVSLTATGPGTVHPHLRNQQSTVPGSSSSSGWYRDLNGDSVLSADEYEVFEPWADGNLMFELSATALPVPEPASLLVLALPLAVLAKRRRANSPQ